MAKKMYYTEEETIAKLGIDAATLTNLVRDQKLRVFRDGARNMFRADEVDALETEPPPAESAADSVAVDSAAAESVALKPPPADTAAAEEEIELTPADTSSGSSISLVDSMSQPPPPGKEDTVITAEGVSIFDEEDLDVEAADPMAKTQVTMRMEDQVASDGSGSGSGLLDLTRESDDTSLGEVLDRIEMDSGAPPIIEEAAPAQAPVEPVVRAVVEQPDPLAGLFGGLAVGCALGVIILAAVAVAAVSRAVPTYLEFFAGYKAVVLAGVAVIVAVAAVAGHVTGQGSASKKGAGG